MCAKRVLFSLTNAVSSVLIINFLLQLSDLPSLNFPVLHNKCCPSLWPYSAQTNGTLGQGYHYWTDLLAYSGSMSSYSVFVKHVPSKDQNTLRRGKQTNKPTPKLFFLLTGPESWLVLIRAWRLFAREADPLAQHRDDRGAIPTEKLCQNVAPSRVLTHRQGLEQKLKFLLHPRVIFLNQCTGELQIEKLRAMLSF